MSFDDIRKYTRIARISALAYAVVCLIFGWGMALICGIWGVYCAPLMYGIIKDDIIHRKQGYVWVSRPFNNGHWYNPKTKKRDF